MSSTTEIFSGSSRFVTDLQSVVTRSVAIASLPLTQLNNRASELGSKQTAWSEIASVMSSVRSAVDAVASASKNAYSASSTQIGVASVSVAAGAGPGSYSIEVVRAGSYSQFLSDAGVSDPAKATLGGAASYTLEIDGVGTTITPASATLSGLALAINQAGLGVQASVLNLGSSSAPDYKLSLRSTEWKSMDVSLRADGEELIGKLSDGQTAAYRVNGQPSVAIEAESAAVTIAPGVTATLGEVGSTTISVVRDASALSTALGSLATAYNAAVSKLNEHRGQNLGVLKGDSQISNLASKLRSLVNFNSSQGTLVLGLKFDKSGVLSVDAAAMSKQPEDVVADFLGDASTSGFLKNADSVLDSIEDNAIPNARDVLSAAVQRNARQISAMEERISLLEDNLNARMAAADSLIASLEQNVTYFKSMFEAMSEANSN
jgi:flagellar hook-associated protein 2